FFSVRCKVCITFTNASRTPIRMRAPIASPPRPDPHVGRWIARELAASPPRAPSLTITVWGDAIAPHGGAVMLPGLIRLLEPFGSADQRTDVIAVTARDDGALHGSSLSSAVPRAWDLTGIAADYRKFLRRFGGVIERFRLAGSGDHDPEQCFIVRTLLIHEYR